MPTSAPPAGRPDGVRRHRVRLGLALLVAGGLTLVACGNDNLDAGPVGSTAGITCAHGALLASGSSAQENAMAAWIKTYQAACPEAQVNYGGGGSGKGFADFVRGTDDFAGSDYPLSAGQRPAADQHCHGTALDLPMTPGAIAVGYNLPGVPDLRLSARTLGAIFSGKLARWDDPAIAADNPGVHLPSTAISTFHRADTSGTSYNFSNYLFQDSGGTWSTPADKQWPSQAGGQGSKGTAGVAQGVASTPGGIGYMESSYATATGIATARVGDRAGNFVAPTVADTTRFLAQAQVVGTGGDLTLALDYDAPAPDRYPASLVTYELVCATGNRNAPLLKDFLGYTAGTGQSVLGELGYVPLPANLQEKVRAAIEGLS